MILKRLFNKPPAPERLLYEAIVAAARRPRAYAEWGVADTIDGRFDMICLHTFLVLDRLKGRANDLRQNLVDELFRDMDRSLREMGVGDISVGKKVRKMAEVFYGRVAAYDTAVTAGRHELERAIARNVYGGAAPERGLARLTDDAMNRRIWLASLKEEDLVAGVIAGPEAAP